MSRCKKRYDCLYKSFAHTHTRCCLFVCYTRGFDKTNSRPGEGNDGTHTKEKIPFEIASTEVDGKGNGHFVCCTHLSRKGRLTVTHMINK